MDGGRKLLRFDEQRNRAPGALGGERLIGVAGQAGGFAGGGGAESRLSRSAVRLVTRRALHAPASEAPPASSRNATNSSSASRICVRVVVRRDTIIQYLFSVPWSAPTLALVTQVTQAGSFLRSQIGDQPAVRHLTSEGDLNHPDCGHHPTTCAAGGPRRDPAHDDESRTNGLYGTGNEGEAGAISTALGAKKTPAEAGVCRTVDDLLSCCGQQRARQGAPCGAGAREPVRLTAPGHRPGAGPG